MQVRTSGDLINIGGAIIADSALNLVAGGNLILTASVVENEMHDGSKSHTVDAYSRTNYGGTVYSGGDASLYAGNDMRIEGSNVIALGNASLMAGHEISITSVLDESSLDQSGKKGNIISSKSWSSSDHSETNVSSTIFAGGNLTVAAAGNVAIHASHLIAGDDMVVVAGAGTNGDPNASVTITAGQDSTSHSESRSKSGLFSGGDGWADIWHSKKTESSTDLVTNAGSSLSAGGNVTITAKNDINLQGSSVSAGGIAALDAGNNINITPGFDGYDSSYKREEKGIGMRWSAYDGSFKQQAGYHSDKIELGLDTTSVVSSIIQGGAGVSLIAGNDINLQAAIIASPGDITLTAGHDINAGVAYDTTSTIAKHDEKFFGVTAQVSQNVTGIISDLRSASEIARSGHGGAAYEAVGVVSGVLKATDAILTAAGGPRVSASVTVGGEGHTRSSYETSATAVGTVLDAGGNLTLNAGNNIHLVGTQAHANHDLSLSAGNSIIIESSQSYAASGSKDESWSAGIGVGASAGVNGVSFGLQLNGSFATSDNEAWAIQQNNSYVTAGNTVTITSGKDTTIAGAIIHGSEVKIDVGGDLTIQSRQDTAHAEGESFHIGGSATIGMGASFSPDGGKAGSGGIGFGSSESDVAWVTQQTGVYSDGKLDITVGHHTQLDGAVIASNTGELTLDTGTLGFSTIKDHDRGSAFDVSVSGGTSTLTENKYPWMPSTGGGSTSENENKPSGRDPQTGSPGGASVGGSIEEHDREQDTNATIGAGTIIIRDPANQQQDVATLNRDLDQAQVITRDESHGTQFYASSSSLAEAAQGFKNIPQAMVDAVLNAAKGIDVAGKGVEAAIDALAAALAKNGDLTPEEAKQAADTAKKYKGDPEAVAALASCGGGKQGFNLLDLFITPAYAFQDTALAAKLCEGLSPKVAQAAAGMTAVAMGAVVVIAGVVYFASTTTIGGVETKTLVGADGSSTTIRNDGPAGSVVITVVEPNGDRTTGVYRKQADGTYQLQSAATIYGDGRGDGSASSGAMALVQAGIATSGVKVGNPSPNTTTGAIGNVISNVPLGLGSTGRTTPDSLEEQLAMKQAMSDPGAGIALDIQLTDPRWPASAGWVKARQNINGIEIHYVVNTITGTVDDFKFK